MGANMAINLEAFECPLREWIAEERTRREIQRRFREFLETFFVGIEEVNRWRRLASNRNPDGTLRPLPPNMKVSHPIYPPKIK